MADPVSKAELLALLDLIQVRTESLRQAVASNSLTTNEIRTRQAEIQRLQQRAAQY